jgi:hypothetical protein
MSYNAKKLGLVVTNTLLNQYVELLLRNCAADVVAQRN